MSNGKELVTLTIDGKEVKVPQGTLLIEAAKQVGIEIPHYCYHPCLSIAGNCRMCQVKVQGAPKLVISCHAQVQEGMQVNTHYTSEEVHRAQGDVLEFLLANHPLDCTVCDQAGHCKLQDYHYEYSARPSRFLENKTKKPKAKPLGPTVMLDAERCIACTRCIRFCDEITGTSELCMINRSDRYEIDIYEGKELNNPFSGCVVDLCPVGALTHRKWRFNTRIWYADKKIGVCPGCSTGCNVEVYQRDGKVVQVKGRLNMEVNQQWLCDEGRYGFNDFLPQKRIVKSYFKGEPQEEEDIVKEIKSIPTDHALIFISPLLYLEEMYLVKQLRDKALKDTSCVLAYRSRNLSELEKILISPDYAPNFSSAVELGLVSKDDLKEGYKRALSSLRGGSFKSVWFIGEGSFIEEFISQEDLDAIKGIFSVGILTNQDSPLLKSIGVLLPGQSVIEKSGLLINNKRRLQYSEAFVPAKEGTRSEWEWLLQILSLFNVRFDNIISSRDLTRFVLQDNEVLSKKITLKEIKDNLGVNLG